MRTRELSNNKKVVLIGLDGGAFHVLRPLIDAGVMPILARFLREGASGLLLSTRPPVTVPAWPTMFTGVNPGRHGIFSFTCRKSGRGKPHTASLMDVKAPTLWELLGSSGYRVGIMNVPVTFPAQPVNGFMVSGFPAPDGLSEVVWPREEYDKLIHKFPDFLVNWPGLGKQASNDAKKVSAIKSVNAWLRARIRVFEYFLDRHCVDFCFLVFEYTDKVQHWFYPLLNSMINKSFTDEDSEIFELLKEGYGEIDRAIARLVERFGENANYIVVSDHGFGPVNRVVYLNHLLEQHGLFTPRRMKALAAKAASLGRFPLCIRSRLGLAQDEPWHRLDTWESPLTNFSRTKAFAGHQYEQAIYINVIDKCFHGVVQPGSEYNAIRRKIVNILRQAKDFRTGKFIFEGAWPYEEIYTGEYIHNSPDVIFDLAPGYVVSAGIGLSIVLDNGFLRNARESDGTGFHRPDGIFLGYGPAFRSTQNVNATLLDVAPTVLALMGVMIPAGMDGCIIEEAVWPSSISFGHKAKKVSKPTRERASDSVYSLDDEKEIARRLADLGYL